jgi:ribosomal protein L11 methyltransferase
MSWIEIKLNIPQEKMDDISAYIFAQGCQGINVTDNNVLVYFSQFRWSNETKLAIISYIKEFVPTFGPRDVQVLKFADQDWNKKWKEYFKPLRVSRRIVVRPSWENYKESPGDLVVTIDPQMAFGTGHHESTQLMIIAIEKWLKEGMDVLDVGTGSAILAIIAAKLGAESVMAFDNDPVALKNAMENTQMNGVSKIVQLFMANPEMLQPSEYDLILANINRNILLKYVNLFPELLKPGGKLILSGLLLRDEPKMLQEYQNAGFSLVEKNAKKEWLILVLELKNQPQRSQRRHKVHKENNY